MSMIVGFKKLPCTPCLRVRYHETYMGLAKCVSCFEQRNDTTSEPNDVEIERFIH